MLRLNLPDFHPMLQKDQAGRLTIWDGCRKMMVHLTPEEWVRQHLLNGLNVHRGVPLSCISVERGSALGRWDFVVYGTDKAPWLLAECKSPDTKLSLDTLLQAVRYAKPVRPAWLLLSNGLQHQVYSLAEAKWLSGWESVPLYPSQTQP